MRHIPRASGLRREVVFFLPAAFFLLVGIVAFDLLAYRNALRTIETERLAQAATVASRAAARLATGGAASESPEWQATGAVAMAIHTERGPVGRPPGAAVDLDLPALLGPTPPDRATAFGPEDTGRPVIAAVAPFERDGRRHYLQLDFPAVYLSAQLTSLGRILLLNIVIVAPLALLALLFLRGLLAPYDLLFEKARELDGGQDAGGADETEYLVRTLERAREALEAHRSGGDEIAVIERALAPSLESGFLLLDPQGRVLSLNDLGASLLRVEPPETGASLESLLAHEPDLAQLIGEAVAGGVSRRRRECGIGARGERRVLGLTVHPLRRDDGDVRGFIVLFTDLTDIQAAERQSQISRNLSHLGEIAAGVAHEMRNGLGTLKGYLALIEQSPEEESVHDYLEEMQTETDHLQRVLSDFLSFARPGSLRSATLDLVDLVTRATADPALAEADFELVSAPGPLELAGDRQLLDRALRNLLQNALDAQRENGSTAAIGVRVELADDGVELLIEDRGDGLPPELRDSLFQPFVSGRPDGVGLGLALALRIVELHEGTLELTDRAGGGTRARLRLPVARGT